MKDLTRTMIARINAESGADDDDSMEQTESGDACDWEATDVGVGLQRSSSTIRAPQRLLEESGVSVDKRAPDWKYCLMKM
jgi:hypothetical protein